MNKNERRVLEELSKNAKTTDKSIAEKLRITTQAVGKIRKKLEKEKIIVSYNIRLNPKAIGLNVINILAVKFSPENVEREEELKHEITKDPRVTDCYRMLHGQASLLIVAAFKDMEESEAYIKQFFKKHPELSIINLQTATWNTVWKNTKKDVYLHSLKS